MMKNTIDIQIAIQNLKSQLSKASSQFHQWEMIGEDWYNPSWLIESCFFQLLTVTEALDYSSTAEEDWYFVSPYKHWRCSLEI